MNIRFTIGITGIEVEGLDGLHDRLRSEFVGLGARLDAEAAPVVRKASRAASAVAAAKAAAVEAVEAVEAVVDESRRQRGQR